MTVAAQKTAIAEKPLTSADVRACILSHFGSGGGQYAVLFEVRNGTAWRANRSVDAVVMSLWPSLGMELWGMEIKTARHDWRRELSSPSKASELFDYFDRWFLVAPNYVAKPDELPEPWGWFVPTGGRLRRAREAAKNANVKTVDRHFLGALLRRVAKTDDTLLESAIATATAEQRRLHDQEIDKRVLERIGVARKDAEQWAQVRELLKDKPDDYVYQPDVIEALKLLVKCGIGKSYSSLASLIAEVDRMKELLDAIRDGPFCHWCGLLTREVPSGVSKLSPDHRTIDHVKPRGAGGTDDPDNLVVACYRCNQKRSRESCSPPITEAQLIALLAGGAVIK